jgi:hypothetical protein
VVAVLIGDGVADLADRLADRIDGAANCISNSTKKSHNIPPAV